MRPALRIALVVVGLVVALYGTASLTGGWLGTPPWWERVAPMDTREWIRRYRPEWRALFPRQMGGWRESTTAAVEEPGRTTADWGVTVPSELADPWNESKSQAARHVEPRGGREWISGCVVVAGLVIAVLGAWPRRRRLTA